MKNNTVNISFVSDHTNYTFKLYIIVNLLIIILPYKMDEWGFSGKSEKQENETKRWEMENNG